MFGQRAHAAVAAQFGGHVAHHDLRRCALASRRPELISRQELHSDSIEAMLWLTKIIVRPSRATSPILPMHFFWKAASPTASTSSTSRISGSRWAATAKPSRTCMPLE